ncbi:hypothetical protein Cgig2_002717 [Carnegiea gigantea]|uniref:Uncharacterized protein n=1 Tax=Carnegiea gigantea TaxID=171969 RepID=A0A9Q1GN04_9CARY|nr:hypothetical protein Cgig2_002717 [Carnegiea gigantea]
MEVMLNLVMANINPEQSFSVCLVLQTRLPLRPPLGVGSAVAVGDVAPHLQQRRTPSLASRVNVSPPKGGLQDKDVRKYFMCGLSADDETLLRDVRKQCKFFRDSHEWLAPVCNSVYNLERICVLSRTPMSLTSLFLTMSFRLSNLTEGGVSDIVAIDVKGLVNVVPRNGPGDKAKDYCINGFTNDNYSALLAEQQRLFPKWCRHSLFAKTTELIRAKLAAIGCLSRYLMSTQGIGCYYRLICVADKVPVALAVMKTDIYTDALTWDLIHVECPQQEKFVPHFQLSSLIGVSVCHTVHFQCTWVDDVVRHGRRRVRVWYTLPALCPTREAW